MLFDDLAAGLVICFFLVISIILIRTGRTKLKSRYAYMLLSFLLCSIILLYLMRTKRSDSKEISMLFREPLSNDIIVSKRKVLRERHVTVEAATTVALAVKSVEAREKRQLLSPKVKPAVRLRVNYKPVRRYKERARAVQQNLFVELNKNRDSVEKHLTKEKDINLVPSILNSEARIRYKDYLPWWEVEEMINYPDIWYFGVNSSKFRYEPDEHLMNFGFDEWEDENAQDEDDEKMLKIALGDHLEYRYEIVKVLGHGSYGRVVFARDHALPNSNKNHEVAIKIMHNESQTVHYFKKEIDMMDYIQSHTLVPELYTKVLRTFFFRNHFCMVFELLGKSLFRTVDDPVEDMSTMQRYLKDILIPLKNLHRIQVVHGDLKPENLMMIRGCNESCEPMMKLADFNLACTPALKKFPCSGVYFQTRHYRAPEVILELDYTVQADMWSIGVMIAEMFLGHLPFYGETTTDQLAATMEVLGLIPADMVKVSPRIETYQKAVNYKCKNGFKRKPYRKPLERILKEAPPLLFDFVRNCLKLDPNLRMTSSQALEHPFMKKSYALL